MAVAQRSNSELLCVGKDGGPPQHHPQDRTMGGRTGAQFLCAFWLLDLCVYVFFKKCKIIEKSALFVFKVCGVHGWLSQKRMGLLILGL